MSNDKPIFRCVKSRSSSKNEWVKPEPSIPVSELREWCEFHRVCPRHRSIEEIETGYNNALDDILDELCKGDTA